MNYYRNYSPKDDDDFVENISKIKKKGQELQIRILEMMQKKDTEEIDEEELLNIFSQYQNLEKQLAELTGSLEVLQTERTAGFGENTGSVICGIGDDEEEDGWLPAFPEDWE